MPAAPAVVALMTGQRPGTWLPVTSDAPPPYVNVLLTRAGDITAVVGWRMEADGGSWHLEEGGAEDDERRRYPALWWTPTHWFPLMDTPDEPADGGRS